MKSENEAKKNKGAVMPKDALERFDELQEKMGIKFHDQVLLHSAFTHSSYVNENRRRNHTDNERLEFLGDAVLELIVSQFLYKAEPNKREGELTKMRAAVVCEPSLVQFADELDFGRYVLLGKGEERTGGRTRPSLLADVFEAFIGALYIDHGMEAVTAFLKSIIYPRLLAGQYLSVTDHKSELQEIVQRKDSPPLEYEVVEEQGPAHAKIFLTVVRFEGKVLGRGSGRSKKEAEQDAARDATQYFERKRIEGEN